MKEEIKQRNEIALTIAPAILDSYFEDDEDMTKNDIIEYIYDMANEMYKQSLKDVY